VLYIINKDVGVLSQTSK